MPSIYELKNQSTIPMFQLIVFYSYLKMLLPLIRLISVPPLILNCFLIIFHPNQRLLKFGVLQHTMLAKLLLISKQLKMFAAQNQERVNLLIILLKKSVDIQDVN